jgi:hypothetical protein
MHIKTAQTMRASYVIPALVVAIAWLIGAAIWLRTEYHIGGTVHFASQAIEIAKAACGRRNHYYGQSWDAEVQGDTWFAYSELRAHFWSPLDGGASVMINAKTGEVIECETFAV